MIKNLSGKRAGILYAIIIFFFGGLLFLYLQAYIVPEGRDSADYCRLALSFINGWGGDRVKDGFSLRNYPKWIYGIINPRGYVLPLFILFVDKMTPFTFQDNWQHWGMEICSIIAVLFLGGIWGRYFFSYKKDMGYRERIIKLIVWVALFFYFWIDLVAYTLSDIWPPFLVGVVMIVFLEWEKIRHYIVKVIMAFGCGVLLYAAYNIRSIWMFTVIPITILLWVKIRASKKDLAIAIPGVLIGALFAALPQMLINYYWFGVASPALMGSYGESQSLFLESLYKGIFICRYDTCLDRDSYPAVVMLATKTVGENILEKENITRSTLTYSVYIRIVLKHWIEFIQIYLTNFVHMMTPIFRQIYITHLDGISLSCVFGSYIMYGVSGLNTMISILCGNIKKLISYKNLFILCYILPAIIATVGLVEIRYGLSLYLVIFSYFIYSCSFRKIWYFLKHNKKLSLLYLLAACIIGAMALSMVFSTLVNGAGYLLLFH